MQVSADELVKLGAAAFTLILAAAGFLRAARNWIRTRDNVATLKADVLSLQTSNQTLRTELTQVQTELVEKNRASIERDARIDALTEQARQIQNSAREVERTNNMLQGRLAEQRDLLGTQITQQAAEIALLRLEVARRDERIKELEQSEKDKELTLTRANETIARLEKELQTECTERLSLDERVKTLEQKVAEMTAERTQLIEERNKAVQERDEALTKLSEADQKIADLTRQLAEREQRIQQLEAQKLSPVDEKQEAS